MVKRVIIWFIFLGSYSYGFQNPINPNQEQVIQLLNLALEVEYSNWEKAQKLINKAEKISTNSDNDEVKAMFNSGVAVIYYDRDLLDISLKYNLEALNYFKGKNQSKALECESLIAIIYARMNNKKESLKYFQNYYNEIRKQDKNLSLKTLNNIGNLYLNNGDNDSAIFYFKKAVNQLDAKTDNNLIIMLYANLGKALSSTNQDLSEKYFLYAKSLSEKLNNDPLKAVLYNHLSEFYLKINKPNLAVNYAEEAKKYTKVKFSFENSRVYKNLYQSNLAAGNYKAATEYFKVYDEIRNNLNIEEKAVNIEKEKILFSFKNKEKEIQLINEQKRTKLVYTILFLIIILVTLFLIIIQYRNKLEKERLEKDLSKSKENELKLILELRNKELVSKSIIENEQFSHYQQIKQDLIKIKKIDNNDELRKEVNTVILRLIKNPSTIYWNEFELRFNNVYDSFYDKLMEKHPDLSNKDKKLCALMKLNLCSKDIASITQTSLKSVENSRTRLRKKLNLTHSNIDLHNYLSKF